MAIHFDTQGPAPDGFHVPSRYEWDDLVGILYSSFGFPKNGATMKTYLKLPLAGRRSISSSDVSNQGSYGYYWTPSYMGNYSYYFWVGDSSVEFTNYTERGSGYSLRCFKDRPVTPDNSRTQLHDGGDGPQGELTGVYHNATLGLISISSNGTSRTTIQDKNLGATTVYNDGDTLSEANCGKYYQRGNNYGFPFTGTISRTSSTQVDASTYGPGNYYENDTFIILTRRDSSGNQNLWGGKTNGTWGYPDMRLHGAIQTFHRAPKPPTSITLNESAIIFSAVGDTQQLTATVSPGDASADFIWASNNTSIATVSNTGLVTCISLGNCVITCTAKYGSATASCSVINPENVTMTSTTCRGGSSVDGDTQDASAVYYGSYDPTPDLYPDA